MLIQALHWIPWTPAIGQEAGILTSAFDDACGGTEDVSQYQDSATNNYLISYTRMVPD